MITNYLKNKYQDKGTQESIQALILGGLIIGAIITFASLVSEAGELAGIVISFLVGFIIILVLSINTELSTSFTIGTSVALSSSILCMIVYDIITWTYYPWWVVGTIVLMVTEILFLFDKTSPNTIELDKKGLMWFTTKRKIEAFLEAIIILTLFKNIYKVSTSINFVKIYSTISPYFIYVLEILAVVVAIYAYIWINSLRYRKV